jgi:uncharacterized protein DUF1236
MRRTWIGAAAAAGLTTAAATGFAVAQQQSRQDQTPAGQQMETGQTHRGEEKMGHEPADKGKAALTGKMTGDKRAREENKTSAQGAQNNRETGAAAGQANTPANVNRAGHGQTRRNDNEGQNARANPQNVRAEGNAHLSNDRAARIADTLMATAGPEHVNVKVRVGEPIPGDVNLMPLPNSIVDLVPEYRDYDYVVVNDEIVIVQPSTRHVVEVISTGGGVAMNESGGGEQAMAGTRVNPCGNP